MEALVFLIPAALFLGLLGLGAFLWSLRTGQYDDLDGAAHRILFDDDPPSAAGKDGPRPNAPPPQDSAGSTKPR
jgi:cbb3-type cytochrome oxidase maturation protein